MNAGTGGPKTRLNRSCQMVLMALGNIRKLVSAQEIYAWLKENEGDPPGLTSVYRAIDFLLGQKLIQAVEFGDGERRYEEVVPGEHHHHLICDVCKGNVHLEQCYVDRLVAGIEELHEFEIKSHVLEIFGLCKDCAALSREE
jgi:Fur family ferric uptake transcriptional regulator